MGRLLGWSMPPGCSRVPGDEEGPCAVCAKWPDDCVCPECVVCGEQGNPQCYATSPIDEKDPIGMRHTMALWRGHGLKLTREQIAGRVEARLAAQRAEVVELERQLGRLRDGKQNDDALFNDDHGEFSRDLADNPDPWR